MLLGHSMLRVQKDALFLTSFREVLWRQLKQHR